MKSWSKCTHCWQVPPHPEGLLLPCLLLGQACLRDQPGTRPVLGEAKCRSYTGVGAALPTAWRPARLGPRRAVQVAPSSPRW